MSDAVETKTKTPGVYRRGNRYVVRFKDREGKSRKRYARTYEEARTLKGVLVADLARGEYRQGSRVSFEVYANEWLRTYQGRTGRGVRQSTRDDYTRNLKAHAVPFFGATRMTDLEPRDLKRFAAHVASRTVVDSEGVSRPVSANTVRLALAPVRALLATALEDGMIRTNPALGVRTPRPDAPEADDVDQVKALTVEQLRDLLAQIPVEHELLVRLMAETGVRISEALGLQWRDVDFGAKRLSLSRRVYKGTVGPLKTKYARRRIPLTDQLAQDLWAARAVSRGALAADFIFTTATGQALDRVNLGNRMLKPAARRAGVPWASWHSLRHTCATLLFKAGWNAKQVQLMLGHHSPAFTLATYIHLLDSDLPQPALDLWGDTEGDTSPTETSREAATVSGSESAILQAVSR